MSTELTDANGEPILAGHIAGHLEVDNCGTCGEERLMVWIGDDEEPECIQCSAKARDDLWHELATSRQMLSTAEARAEAAEAQVAAAQAEMLHALADQIAAGPLQPHPLNEAGENR